MSAEQPTAKAMASGATFEAGYGIHAFPNVRWFGDALKQLDAIENLPDGWDSHRASRPDSALVRKGAALLVSLSEADKRLSKPRIEPTPSGGVQFCWECGQRYLEIEVLDQDRAQFYYADGDARSEATAEFALATPPASVLGYLRLFCRDDV